MGYTLYRKLDGGKLSPTYHYADQQVLHTEYFMANWFNCTFPDCPFVKQIVISLLVKQGRRNLIYGGESEGAKVWTSIVGQENSYQYLKTFGEFKQCLIEQFGLIL